MNNWDFISDDKLFSLQLPENWLQYDDEENVVAFFNTKKWSGNLRITHFFWENADPETDKASLYTQSEFENEPNAVKVRLNKWNAVFYSKESESDGLIYFWTMGSKNDIFICSFTFDKPFLNTNWHNDELIVVSEILGSIKLSDQSITSNLNSFNSN